jgi:hypothetical protein
MPLNYVIVAGFVFASQLVFALHTVQLYQMSKPSITRARCRLHRDRSFMHLRGVFLFPLALVLYICFLLRRYTGHSSNPFSAKVYLPGWKGHPAVFNSSDDVLENLQADVFGPLYELELGSVKTISNPSITVALPLTEKSAQILEATIAGLLEHPFAIKEIVILCPETLLSIARSLLRHFLASYGPVLFTPMTLLRCHHPTCSAEALIGTAFHASTDWILFLEETGLQEVNKAARSLLLNPPAVTFPLGLKGFALPTPEAPEGICLTPLAFHRPADFLVPPFVLPSFILSDENACKECSPDSWSALGRFISVRRPDTIGGIIASRDLAGDSCFESQSELQDTTNKQRIPTLPTDDYRSRIFDPELLFSNNSTRKPYGYFGLFLPTLGDLVAFSRAACGLATNGHRLDIFLYAEADSNHSFISTDICALHYHTSSSATATADSIVSSWLSHLSGPPDVFIALAAEDAFTASLLRVVRGSEYTASTLVRLAHSDLIYSDWMGTLSLTEWQSMSYKSRYLYCSDFNRLVCTPRGYQHHYEQ